MPSGRLAGQLVDLRPLRSSREFRALWIGGSLSGFGLMVTNVAVLYQVWQLTRSTFWTGMIGVVTAVPTILGGIVGGHLADRMDRRRLAALGTAARILTGLGLLLQAAVHPGPRPVQLAVLLVLVGLQFGAGAVGTPARRTFRVRFLPPDQLAAGITLDTLTFQVAVLAGPALAGLLLARFGLTATYVVQALGSTAALIGLTRLPPVPPEPTDSPDADSPNADSPHADSRVLGGVTLILRRPVLWGSFATDLAASLLSFPVAVFPLVNAERFHDSPRTLGLFLSALAVGGIAAGLFSGAATRVRRAGIVQLVAAGVWGLALVGFGLAAARPGLGVLIFAFLAVAGAADMVSVSTRSATVQLVTPDVYRGRVSAVDHVIGLAGPELGNFRGGVLAGLTSAPASLVIGGLSASAVVALVAAVNRPLREVNRRADERVDERLSAWTVDAVVVGAGPNGLAAALTLAEAGYGVRVLEAADTPGGGCRTAELTLPGFAHDVCSTVQALAVVSPFFRTLDLEALGVTLRRPPIAYAQPLDGGAAALAYEDVERTADGLGRDGAAWRSLLGPLLKHWPGLFGDVLSDLRHVPKHPVTLARFGLPGLLSIHALAKAAFREEPARALFAGAGAHSMRSLHTPLTSAFGLVLAASAHVSGWPVVEGGSERLIDAMVKRLAQLGVTVECGRRVTSLAELPPARVTLLNVGPDQLARMAGDRLPDRYRRGLRRFRFGPGVFKVDYALSEPVPWTNPEVRSAGTVHLGGTMAEVTASEHALEHGRHADRPYVLTVQAGVADPTRAPEGKHTFWAYCHVPNGSNLDRTKAIEDQIERFAPGFGDVVLARVTRTAIEYQAYDANYVGGDINAGRAGLYSSVLGPVPAWSRYRTPLPGVYLCSSSTPPGGGVHGMSGMNAAREAIRRDLA